MDKKILTIALLIASLACSNSKIKKTSTNTEFENTTFNIGNIYIGNQEYLDNLNDINSNDILILDLRNDESDPDIKIIDSYKIIDSNSMDKILDEIIKYEELDPSNWYRTVESMKYEWMVHNFAYFLNYETERSKDVDLNNNDEIKYSKQLVKGKK